MLDDDFYANKVVDTFPYFSFHFGLKVSLSNNQLLYYYTVAMIS